MKKDIRTQFYFGSCNVGVLSFGSELLNFSTGDLVLKEEEAKRSKKFYNALVGPTFYPELAEKVSLKYKLDDFIQSEECKKLFQIK